MFLYIAVFHILGVFTFSANVNAEAYSSKTIQPISELFAQPTLTIDKEPRSFANSERKEEIKVRLTLTELSAEMERWDRNIYRCKYTLADSCAKDPIKSNVTKELDKFSFYRASIWAITHRTAKPNATAAYELIEEAKNFLIEIESNQVDLCRKGDDECQQCLEQKADFYFSNNMWCTTYREWHIVNYKPKQISTVTSFC